MRPIDRRDFLGLIAGATVARALAGSIHMSRPALRISFSGASRDMERGATMAVEEAQRAAALFGGAVAIGEGTGLPVVIGGVPGKTVHEVHMNVLEQRPEAHVCQRQVFHIASGSWGITWLPTLTRFGADSLNKRYRARYGAGMTPTAWCAWFAVKCAWEAVLKSRATDATGLIAYLESPAARFDGHKGVALFFDASHELRQPMYDDKGEETFQDHPKDKCVWK